MCNNAKKICLYTYMLTTQPSSNHLLILTIKNFKINKALPCTLANPCQNGAGCTNNLVGGYTCLCATGYTGINCSYGKKKTKILGWNDIIKKNLTK